MRGRCTRAIGSLLAVFAFAVSAQIPVRLIDQLDVTERSDHVDISFLFGCSLQYRGQIGQTPTDTIRIRFQPGADCGNFDDALASTPLLADAARYVLSLDWDHLVATELTLTVRFRQKQQYLLAPAGDGRGLRLRLLQSQASQGNVQVGDTGMMAANYAVNLDVSQTPFDAAAVARATSALGNVPVYVSTYTLPGPTEDQTWYRLRAGPFPTRQDAEKLLRTARAAYPKAWLAIGDEERLEPGRTTERTTEALPTLPGKEATLTATEAADMLALARKDFSRRQYADAIPLFTRLLEQPEFPQRAEAQELMGLTRERNRELAHAKAEYEEYLRRYPNGPAVKRVRERLRALALATRAPGVSASAFGEDEYAWKVYGGVSQHYRRDTSKLDNTAVQSTIVSQNALLNVLDTVVRKRGERFDFTARVGGDYIKDLLPNGPGDRTRVGTLFVDLADRDHNWSTRFGRQTQNTAGLFGTFDGLSGGWQVRPHLRLQAAVGYPVELASNAPDTGRRFVALASDFGTFAQAWDVSLYTIMQQLSGLTDRQVLGAEVKYFRPGRTLVALTDYDVHFKAMNSAFLLGSLTLPSRWTFSVNVDRRRSPSLSLRNALIGQTASSFDALTALYTPQELDQFALDRSALTSLYDLGVSRPFGERWQWSLDLSAFSQGATQASGGVDAVSATGFDKAGTLQAMVFGLFRAGDVSTFALRRQIGSNQDVDSVGLSTRLPVWGSLRLGPSVRVDRRLLHSDGTLQWLYVPGLRLDLQRQRFSIDFEAGTEFGRRDLGVTRETSTRYYFSLGYRMNF